MEGGYRTDQRGFSPYWITQRLAELNCKHRHNDLAVLLVLSAHANRKSGSCTLSYETIAREIGATYRTAIRSIDRLEADGWIHVVRGGGKGRANKYTWPDYSDTQSVTDSQGDPQKDQAAISDNLAVTDCDGQRVTDTESKGDRSDPIGGHPTCHTNRRTLEHHHHNGTATAQPAPGGGGGDALDVVEDVAAFLRERGISAWRDIAVRPGISLGWVRQVCTEVASTGGREGAIVQALRDRQIPPPPDLRIAAEATRAADEQRRADDELRMKQDKAAKIYDVMGEHEKQAILAEISTRTGVSLDVLRQCPRQAIIAELVARMENQTQQLTASDRRSNTDVAA